jgi:putative two-component system protein, hydrogenase maturation factor HypX/HoxX
MGQGVRVVGCPADSTDSVVRKIRAAEGHPGVLDAIEGTEFHLFGVQREQALRGHAGEIIAQRSGAICRATVDGAVWITHLRRRDTPGETFFKLPATRALALARPEFDAPEVPVPIDARRLAGHTFREIAYEEHAGVGYLHFDFYNGAMSTEQCRRLHEAYLFARSRRQTKVIALMGGSDFFSNGIHLNVIEAADDPAAESWSNLRAIDDLVREIIETDSHLVLSALAGDVAAGGVPFALAADRVVAREDVVLNPYYGHMGGLYGSEYWTYLLPRRVGVELTARLTGSPFMSLGTRQAVEIGLLDAAFGATLEGFRSQVRGMAQRLARTPDLGQRLEDKRRRRARDEEIKPLNAYRKEELARSYRGFFGEDRSYHQARHRFVHKLGAPCTVSPTAATAAPAGALARAARRAA